MGQKVILTIALAILVTLTAGAGSGLCNGPVMECSTAAFQALGLTDEEFGEPVTGISATLHTATSTDPEHCEVLGNIWPEIGFQVRLSSTWNQRFYMTGCGGSAGTIYDPISWVRQGFAGAGQNTGHWATINPGYSFAYNPPDNSNPNAEQKFRDFAYRSFHETAVLAKKLIKAYYGVGPLYSYYSGASCGGARGMMEAQRYPGDFDGLALGMPPIYLTRSHYVQLWDRRLMVPPGQIGVEKLQMLAKAEYDNCDGIDGLVDGLIDDPRKCTFDPLTELPACPNDVDGPNCFTTAQRETVQKIYDGPRNAAGESLSLGGGITIGSTIFGPSGASLWAPYVVNPPVQFFDTAFKYMYPRPPYGPFGPDWNWATDPPYFDTEPSVPMLEVEKILNASNPDLTKLKKRGAKIIQYHGWSDTLVPSLQSPAYYEDVLKTMGVKATKEFYKLYMVPGYGHGTLAGPGSAPWDATLRDWVEKGIEPGAIIGTRPASTIMGWPIRTRPLCPYPEVARYSGKGSIEDAANFMCVPPVEVRFEPEALNLKSKGVFTAFITVPEDYDLRDWGINNLSCEGAPEIKGMVSEDGRTYIAKFGRQDLKNVAPGGAVTFTVKGAFEKNGKQALFQVSDTIRVVK